MNHITDNGQDMNTQDAIKRYNRQFYKSYLIRYYVLVVIFN